MRYKLILALFLIAFILVLGCLPSSENYEKLLKESCIEATIIGIKLDIERLEGYLRLPDLQNRETVEQALKRLYEDLNKYQNMKVEDYTLPEPIKIVGYINEPYTVDSIIYLKEQSKSGPFYHAVKVLKDRGSEIKPKEIYEFTVYPVYRRFYPFEDWYVCVESFKK